MKRDQELGLSPNRCVRHRIETLNDWGGGNLSSWTQEGKSGMQMKKRENDGGREKNSPQRKKDQCLRSYFQKKSENQIGKRNRVSQYRLANPTDGNPCGGRLQDSATLRKENNGKKKRRTA